MNPLGRPAAVAWVAAMLGGSVGVLALVGHFAGIPILRTGLPGEVGMKFNTAVALLALSIAFLFPGRSRWAPLAFVGVAFVLSGAALAQDSSGTSWGFDELLWKDPEGGSAPGRMAPNTALALLLLSTAIMVARLRGPALASEVLSLGAISVAFGGALGYALELDALSGAGRISMSAPAAFALLALGVASAMGNPRHRIASALALPDRVGTAVRRAALGLMLLPLTMMVIHAAAALAGLEADAVLWASAAVASGIVFFTLASVIGVLRAQETITARILESLSDHAIYRLDPSGRIVSWTPSATALTGYPASEAIGRRFDFLDVTPRGSGPLAAATSGPLLHEGWRRRKDGTEFWATGTIAPLRAPDGTLEGYVKIVRDRTAEKRAEDAVRESEERYRLVAENIGDMVTVTDTQRHFSFVSPSVKALLGYEPGELLGKSTSDLIHPKDLEDYIARRRTLVGGTAPARFELRMQRKDGTYVWIESTSRPVPEHEGSVISVVRDITQRKAAEDQVAQLNRELESRVEARTRDLAEAVKELEAFSYSVSHDLRAPLRAIDGFSQALLEDHRDKLDEDGQDDLARIRAATQRMGSLIDDMLRLSRVSRAPLALRMVDLSEMAREVLDELAKREPKRIVETHVTPGLTAEGDPGLLRAVLQNYLENAWKFTSKHPTATIEFGSEASPEGPAFYVRDDGAGYDPRYSEKLFGAFQRLHAATEFPGNGIGLATVRRIVSRHGGKTWAQGQPEKGATFYFTIPRKAMP